MYIKVLGKLLSQLKASEINQRDANQLRGKRNLKGNRVKMVAVVDADSHLKG